MFMNVSSSQGEGCSESKGLVTTKCSNVWLMPEAVDLLVFKALGILPSY